MQKGKISADIKNIIVAFSQLSGYEIKTKN